MGRNTKIVVSGTAAVTPVGSNAEQTCASVRAGISRFQEHPFFFPKLPDPPLLEPELAISARAPISDPILDNPERLMNLFIPSLTELVSKTKLERKHIQTGAFLMSLPQPDDIVNSWSLESTFMPELYRRTGLRSFNISKVNQSGHAGMLILVQEAMSLLHSGEVEFCIIGGVDSYLMGNRMEYLDDSWRIKSARNVDGYIPGEASTILLLENLASAKSRGCQSMATISSGGAGNESQNISSNKNSSGTGLTVAIEQALYKRDRDTSIKWVLCDLNGESFRSFEWGLVQARLHKYISEVGVVSHPADCMGDIGAATGGMLIAIAVQAFNRGYNVSDEALLWTASDNGQRAALCVSKSVH